MPNPKLKKYRNIQREVLVIWPAFLAACLLEALIFSTFDPGEVHWPGQVSQPTRQAIYTVAFFCFWLISAACAYLILWLEKDEKLVSDTAVVD